MVSILSTYLTLIAPNDPAWGGMGLTPFHALKFMVLQNPFGQDAKLLKCFLNLLGPYPIGTIVELGSGDLAVVTGPPADPRRLHEPSVRIIRNAAGADRERESIDLAAAGLSIVRTLPALSRDIHVGHYLFS
jgi:hypothetical protein